MDLRAPELGPSVSDAPCSRRCKGRGMTGVRSEEGDCFCLRAVIASNKYSRGLAYAMRSCTITGSSGVGGIQGRLGQGSKIRSRMKYFFHLYSAIHGLAFFWISSDRNHNQVHQYLKKNSLSCFFLKRKENSFLRGVSEDFPLCFIGWK